MSAAVTPSVCSTGAHVMIRLKRIKIWRCVRCGHERSGSQIGWSIPLKW